MASTSWMGRPGFSCVAAGALVAICMALITTTTARAQPALGLDFALFIDGVTLEDEERIGPLHETLREDRNNVGLFAGAIHYLHPLGGDTLDGFRVGGELRYLGEYATERDDGDRDKHILGPLFELGFRGDWTTPLAERLGLVVGLRFGLTILVPGKDFADEIDRLADEGVPTSDGPRLGLSLLPSVGARYALHERLHARFDLGFGWTWLDLFDVDAGVQGVQYVRDTTLSGTRFEVALGVELTL